MATLNVNFVRHWDVWNASPGGTFGNVSPLPFNRSGTCCAHDGGNKFDLTSFNATYFNAQKADVEYAASKSMYIMPLLFFIQDYGNATSWADNYWNGGNNINGTTTDYNAAQSTSDATTWGLQQAYVRHFVDTMASEPNVLWEVSNEPQNMYDESVVYSWQEEIINLVHSYEASQGYLHHPIGAEYSPMYLGRTAADFVIPTTVSGNALLYSYGKPVFTDTDHYFGVGGGTGWWWNSFMTGNNALSMDDLQGTGLSGGPDRVFAVRGCCGDAEPRGH